MSTTWASGRAAQHTTKAGYSQSGWTGDLTEKYLISLRGIGIGRGRQHGPDLEDGGPVGGRDLGLAHDGHPVESGGVGGALPAEDRQEDSPGCHEEVRGPRKRFEYTCHLNQI